MNRQRISIWIILTFATLLPLRLFSQATDGFPHIDTVLKRDFPILSQKQRDELLAKGKIENNYSNTRVPLWMPKTAVAQGILQDLKELNPNTGLESLFIIPWPGNALRKIHNEQKKTYLDLYNILRSVSTLKGIQYYSASRKKMRTLFEECYVINSPKDKKRMPDPLVTAIPPFGSFYIYQKDLTFGKAVARITYRYDGTAMGTSLTNITPLYYGFIKAIDPEKMYVSFIIIPTSDYLVFYGTGAVNAFKIPFLDEKTRNSVENRIIAFFNWFSHRFFSTFRQ